MKSCKNCYAAETGAYPIQGSPYGCVLGYKTDGKGTALEMCPKPKSWKQLYALQK